MVFIRQIILILIITLIPILVILGETTNPEKEIDTMIGNMFKKFPEYFKIFWKGTMDAWNKSISFILSLWNNHFVYWIKIGWQKILNIFNFKQ